MLKILLKKETHKTGALFIPIKAANKSSSSKPDLVQTRLMKNWVESSWACETLRAKKSSSNLTRTIQASSRSSSRVNKYTLIVWHLNLVHLQYQYMSLYKISISTNYIFNDIFVVLIWTDGSAKNYQVRYTSWVTSE
jgi:hypothetical protein